MNKITTRILSFATGTLNGLLGFGGGILAVEILTRRGLSQKKSQATALSATVLMSLFSAAYYLIMGYFKLNQAVIYIPFGIPGALLGSLILAKIPDNILKKMFAVLIIFAAVRMLST